MLLPRVRALRDGDAGFTLLEVVVSFVLFGIVALSATAAVANSIKTTSATTNRVTAANIAQQVLAQARADQTALRTTLGARTTVASPNPSFTAVQSTGLGGTVAASGATPCPVGDWINYTVTVSWLDHSTARSVRMDTVFAC